MALFLKSLWPSTRQIDRLVNATGFILVHSTNFAIQTTQINAGFCHALCTLKMPVRVWLKKSWLGTKSNVHIIYLININFIEKCDCSYNDGLDSKIVNNEHGNVHVSNRTDN